MLMCGVLDKFPNHVVNINALACLLSGLILAAMPHSKGLYLLYAARAAYGLFTASILALPPSIIVQIVGNEPFNSALSLDIFAYGLMSSARNIIRYLDMQLV